MVLNIFVHEFQYNVGHSRAMIEVLNHMNPKNIDRINIICYEHDSIEKIMPTLAEKTQVLVIKGKFLKPFLLKSLYFQLYTALFWKKSEPKKEINITMGVCSFVGDVVNIQFAHFLWNSLYFNVTKNGFIKTIYKWLFFGYLNACESYYYRKENLKFVFLSDFMRKSFTQTFGIQSSQASLAYSSANLKRFSPSPKEKEVLFREICEVHPEVQSLDLKNPTFLFVGAFERKGLPAILGKIPENANFVIVGKPEKGSKIQLPRDPNTFYIPHTDIVEKLYQCFDIFVFPTLFEPFGLVILEALMCGMTLVVSKKMVGASELIDNLEGVYFIDAFNVPNLKEYSSPPLANEVRVKRYNERKERLKDLTWENCAKEWEKTLNSVLDDKEE